MPAATVIENVEAYFNLGSSLDQAIDATLESFPGVPDKAEGIRALLVYDVRFAQGRAMDT